MNKYFEKIKEQIAENGCELVEATVTDTMLPVCVAIEIVNQVEEEYKEECEYKEHIAPSGDLYYVTDCKHKHNGYLNGNRPYCGFCGKKIEVVPYQPKGE